ncbi:MAG TPA: TetR/AcrR family transcriptional regulator [Ktedonobacteraceae bacterium]|jgi:AcrR family transcriptional regulator
MSSTTPHGQLKERQRQERAELILETAASILGEKGYHETSMDEIAARVGVAKGTLYQHFASKEDLVLALFARELEKTQQMVDQMISSPGSAREKLETFLVWTYQRFTRQNRQLLWTIYDTIGKNVLEERLHIREHIDRLHPAIESIFGDGKRAGEFDATLSTAVMLTSFLSLLSPRGYELVQERESLTPEELARQVARLFFQGIQAREPDEKRFA